MVRSKKNRTVSITKPIPAIERLYQTMLLYSVLVRRNGRLQYEPDNADPETRNRRRFLTTLAYLCDADKGGTSTTAMAIEERQDGYTLWIACNDPRPDHVSYVEAVRDAAAAIAAKNDRNVDSAASVDDLFAITTRYARDRIACEKDLAVKGLRRSIELLRNRAASASASASASAAIMDLQSLLSSIDCEPAEHKICANAYNGRHSPNMKTLRSHGAAATTPTPAADQAACFQQAYHYIGRLAHHRRAVFDLVETWDSVSTYLLYADVRLAPALPPAERPQKPPGLTIESVLRKHFRSDDPRYESAVERFHALNHKHELFEKFKECYANFSKPANRVVHCEVQLLEHFYRNKLVYVASDRYLATSKRACMMCRLYIKHHPARCVVPSSHNKMWLRWSTPDPLPTDSDAAREEHVRSMRHVIGEMCPELRNEILQRLEGTIDLMYVMKDSTTGITESHVDSAEAEPDDGYTSDEWGNDGEWTAGSYDGEWAAGSYDGGWAGPKGYESPGLASDGDHDEFPTGHGGLETDFERLDISEGYGAPKMASLTPATASRTPAVIPIMQPARAPAANPILQPTRVPAANPILQPTRVPAAKPRPVAPSRANRHLAPARFDSDDDDEDVGGGGGGVRI